MRDKTTIKGRASLVANSRGTLANHPWNMGTPRQEVKTTSSWLPDIQNCIFLDEIMYIKVCLRRLQEPKLHGRGNKPPSYIIPTQ